MAKKFFRNTVNKGYLADLARAVGVSRQAIFIWTDVPSRHRRAVRKVMRLRPWYFKPKMYK